MTSKAFSAQYKTVAWQKKRIKILERDGFTCRMCGHNDQSDTGQLHVHHAYYEKGKKAWEYDDYMLVTLCEKCHKRVKNTGQNILREIAHMSLVELGGLENIVVYFKLKQTLDAFHALGDAAIDSVVASSILSMLRMHDAGFEFAMGQEGYTLKEGAWVLSEDLDNA